MRAPPRAPRRGSGRRKRRADHGRVRDSDARRRRRLPSRSMAFDRSSIADGPHTGEVPDMARPTSSSEAPRTHGIYTRAAARGCGEKASTAHRARPQAFRLGLERRVSFGHQPSRTFLLSDDPMATKHDGKKLRATVLAAIAAGAILAVPGSAKAEEGHAHRQGLSSAAPSSAASSWCSGRRSSASARRRPTSSAQARVRPQAVLAVISSSRRVDDGRIPAYMLAGGSRAAHPGHCRHARRDPVHAHGRCTRGQARDASAVRPGENRAEAASWARSRARLLRPRLAREARRRRAPPSGADA